MNTYVGKLKQRPKKSKNVDIKTEDMFGICKWKIFMSQTFGSNTLLMHGLLFCRTVKRLTLLGLATNLRGNPLRLKALRRWTVAFTHARGSTDLDPYPSDSKLSSLVSHTIQTCPIILTKIRKRRLNFEAHYLFCYMIPLRYRGLY